MAADPPLVPAAAARRLLLAGAGLLEDPRGPATPAAVYRRIERMGFVQVDTINVVDRAHHHVLRSRLDRYDPAVLARLHERDRRLFEHWTHDASLIPTVWMRYWRRRFERTRLDAGRYAEFWRQRMDGRPKEVIAHVRERVSREGPLRARDFEHRRDGKAGSWWGWKPQKAALEFMWRTGELTVVARDNFHKVYDLTERVFPGLLEDPPPSDAEHREWACAEALRRLVVATPSEIAAFFGALSPPEAATWCGQAEADRRIVPVLVASADGGAPRPAWALRDWRARAGRCLPPPRRMRLLSPFDPALRDRARAERLFGFQYRFEAFVPAKKRRYGYYVLPLLEADRLTGRADAKLHREAGRLEIRGLWWERGVVPTATRRRALEAAVDRFARSLGATEWTLPAR